MGRRMTPALAALAVLAILAVSALAIAAAAMSVQVAQGQVRETPTFLGRILAVVDYGQKVEVLETRDPWSRVKTAAGVEGWMHVSALSAKDVSLKSGGADVKAGTSDKELALAGKGFNQQVEDEYKRNNKVDFTWIDRMQDYKVGPEQMQAFLKQGEVLPRGPK